MNSQPDSSLQRTIQGLLDRLVFDGKEHGLQVVAYAKGKLIVDAYAGVLDVQTRQPVQGDSLFPVFSVTKGIAATIIHLFAERGILSYDMPISKIWPAFGSNGKERITLRQALAHSAGIPQIPPGLDNEAICDWERVCEAVAAMPPLWPPGTRVEYHAMTFGWIIGEVARRVDGRPFGQIVQEEICAPLKMEGMYVGIPDEVESRVATLDEFPINVPGPANPGETVPAWFGPLYAIMNRPDVRRSCMPASTGIMSARTIAKHYAALLPEGVEGVELLPPERVRLATEEQVLENPSEEYPKDRALGYHLHPVNPMIGPLRAFGHGGYGGSTGFADPNLRIAVGLTKNFFNLHNSPLSILEELYRGVMTGAA